MYETAVILVTPYGNAAVIFGVFARAEIGIDGIHVAVLRTVRA